MMVLIRRTALQHLITQCWLTGCFTYLLFGVTVAAHGPKIFQSSPQEDYEKTPKESDHGGGEESPPHPLAVAVTGHIWGKRDDHVHLGNVDRGVRAEFIPIFRHFFFFARILDGCQPPPTRNQVDWDSGSWGSSGQRPPVPQRPGHVLSRPPAAPLPSHRAPLAGSKSWLDSRQTPERE